MTTVIIIGIFIFLIILGLTIFTINKGYAFKHTIDEIPVQDDKKTHSHNG
ncbi:YtzI protein [Psychrobacillus antarcticus]|nr:YtzI protein [Psychrobacillus antarcticus]